MTQSAPHRHDSSFYVIRSISGYLAAQARQPVEIIDADDLGPDRLEQHRGDIARVCAMLARDPLKLAPPVSKLRTKICEVVHGVTGFMPAPEQVLMLSVSAMIEDEDRHPRNPSTGMLTPMAQRLFASTVSGYVARSAADLLVAHLDARLQALLGRSACRELDELVRDNMGDLHMDPQLPHLQGLGEAVFRPFRECVRLQTGFIATSEEAVIAKLAVLTGLYCEGNYFLGTVKNGKLLVLVA